MALFPPAIASQDYSTFYNNVMTQPSVDGVTVEIDWSAVETSPPSVPPCAPPDGTHQTDSVGQCHTYSWAPYDTAMSAPGIWTWFNSFGGRLKKVNLLLFGIGTTNGIDTVTPWYVTSSAYVSNFPATYNRQDVLNTINSCSGAPWSGVPASSSVTFTRSLTTVTVDSPGCCSQNATTIHNGDTVYVSSALNPNFATSGTAAAVSGLNPNQFTYTVANTGSTSCSDCVYISQGWSSPVPYEQPYTSAWEAFVSAAMLHYGANYPANSTIVGSAGTNQIGYIRAGTWVGGESDLYCASYLGTLSSPYKLMPTTPPNTWTTDYQSKVQYIQYLGPQSVSYWPINEVGTQLGYPDMEAADAIAAANAFGVVNAFGSQGLSLLDVTTGPCTSGSSASDWCYLFNQYHARGTPLELQQIAISDPTNQSCASGCGVPPGVSGDLRSWLPYAVNNYATTVEMYYRDLGLAFDVNYCTMQSAGACTVGYTTQSNSNITTTQEWIWFSAGNGTDLLVGVGQGSNCTPNAGGIGQGNCAYANAINAAHGPQPQ
jgi:hypothetical protein